MWQIKIVKHQYKLKVVMRTTSRLNMPVEKRQPIIERSVHAKGGLLRFVIGIMQNIIRIIGCYALCLILWVTPAFAQDTAPNARQAAGPNADTAINFGTVPNYFDFRVTNDPPSAEELGSIRFLMSDDFPPFSYRAQDGRLSGFHVDYARALCRTLSVNCTILVRPFSELVGALEDKKGDAILSGLSIPSARAQGLAHTVPYLTLPGRLVAREARAAALMDENMIPESGASVAVIAGTAHEAYAEAFFETLDIVPFESHFLARRAVRDGQVDMLFTDGMALSLWLSGSQSNGCCQFVGGPYHEATYFGFGLAIAVSSDRPKLRQGLDYAIRETHRSGQFTELYLRYFPVSFF